MSTSSNTVPQDVSIPVGPLMLRGLLRCPLNPVGIVLFAHGSGSSRLSTRNTYVAERVGSNGLATLLFDLLTEREEAADGRPDRAAAVRHTLADQPTGRGHRMDDEATTPRGPSARLLRGKYGGPLPRWRRPRAFRRSLPSFRAAVGRTLPAPTSPRCAPQRFLSSVAMTARYWCSTARRSNE